MGVGIAVAGGVVVSTGVLSSLELGVAEVTVADGGSVAAVGTSSPHPLMTTAASRAATAGAVGRRGCTLL